MGRVHAGLRPLPDLATVGDEHRIGRAGQEVVHGVAELRRMDRRIAADTAPLRGPIGHRRVDRRAPTGIERAAGQPFRHRGRPPRRIALHLQQHAVARVARGLTQRLRLRVDLHEPAARSERRCRSELQHVVEPLAEQHDQIRLGHRLRERAQGRISQATRAVHRHHRYARVAQQARRIRRVPTAVRRTGDHQRTRGIGASPGRRPARSSSAGGAVPASGSTADSPPVTTDSSTSTGAARPTAAGGPTDRAPAQTRQALPATRTLLGGRWLEGVRQER